ncbi:hypothetical protein CF319_g5978 [Tilletia indica]|nr:hypothetical protein CF319_g5978 [Tilletia indica]
MASDFSSALTAWRELNLPSLQHDLTAQVNPIVEAQRHALLARKSLAERTREFRSIPEDPPTEKLGALKPLLKAYQSEIDALSKRSKNAENSLLQLHSTLESLPDPYPLLEVILDQTAALTELDSLKATNQRLQQDLQSVHLASEKTQNALTDRIRQLESSFDTRLADGITASQHELTAKYDERLRNAGHREDSLQQSLALAQDQIKELSSAAAAALQESSSSEEQEAQRKNDAAKLAQHDLITAELTRAQGRITTLERRNEELRAELESLRSGREHEDRLAELSSSLHEARTQSDSLREALSLQRARADTAEDERKRKVEELGRKVDEAERVVGVMRKKLAGMADYEEVKRELSIIRSVEFAQYEDGDELDPPTTTSGADSPNPDDAEETTKTLESMLVQKNKKLQDDLTSERVRHNELKATQAQLAAELEVAKGEVDRLKALNGRLEDDLLLLNVQGDGRGEGEKKVDEGKPQNGTAAATSSTADPSTDPFDILLNNPSTSTTTTTSTPNPQQQQQQQQSSSSLLPIITSQRDRFRTRNAELEEELRTQFQTISSLRSEVKQLQTDNLGLYEKVRYLSSYNAAEGGGGGEGSRYPPPYQSAGQSRETRIVVDRSVGRGSAGAGGAGGEERYRDRYEESMDPFASFRGREQSRAFAALNPLERLLHMVTRVVLGHRRMRIAFTVYALGLHVLVLLILFEFEFGGRGTRTRTPSIGITPADQVRPPG